MAPTLLCDVDGTLVDTNYLHTVAWSRAFRDAGEFVPSSRIHGMIGMGADQMLGRLFHAPRADLEDGWLKHYDSLIDEAQPFPGVRDLFERLTAEGVVIMLATSGQADHVTHMLDLLGIEDLIAGTVNASEVEQSKPAPDLFAEALRRADGDPTRALALGDTVWDIEAARGLTIPTVTVNTGGIADEVLTKAGAVAVYADIEDIVARYDASPFAALAHPPANAQPSR